MEGSHYVRAFTGLLIAGEAVESMKSDAFWNLHTPLTRKHCVNFLRR